jgi:hypothetical protein
MQGMDKPTKVSAASILQIFAILVLAGLFSMILHKAVADIANLARLHEGSAFWSALGRYLLANFAS